MNRQTMIAAAIGVGAICATIAGTSCSTNARIDDLRADLTDLRVEVRSEIRSVRDEIQNVRDEIRNVRDLLIGHIDGHDGAAPKE